MSVLFIRNADGAYVPVTSLVGPPGRGIKAIEDNLDGSWSVWYDDGSNSIVTIPVGAPGKDGEPGKQGAPGVSPTVKTTEVDNGHRVTITDVNGDKTFIVKDGERGRSIAKIEVDEIDPYLVVYYDDGTQDEFWLPRGNDGVSPTVNVQKIEGGHRVTITDENGSKTFDVMDGQKGKDGENGRGISKIEQDIMDPYLLIYYDDGAMDSFPLPAGNDGVSPTVSVEEIDGGHRVSITDQNGTKTFDVLNGESATPVKCIVKIEPDIMDPYYWVQYSDGTWEQLEPLEAMPEHSHYADDIEGGVFGGTVYAGEEDQEPEEYLLRNIKVGLTAEDPTTEGEIFFKCK